MVGIRLTALFFVRREPEGIPATVDGWVMTNTELFICFLFGWPLVWILVSYLSGLFKEYRNNG